MQLQSLNNIIARYWQALDKHVLFLGRPSYGDITITITMTSAIAITITILLTLILLIILLLVLLLLLWLLLHFIHSIAIITVIKHSLERGECPAGHRRKQMDWSLSSVFAGQTCNSTTINYMRFLFSFSLSLSLGLAICPLPFSMWFDALRRSAEAVPSLSKGAAGLVLELA